MVASGLQLAKRALVSLLLSLASQYGLRVPRGKEDMRERSEGGVGAEGQRAHEKAWSVSWSLFSSMFV